MLKGAHPFPKTLSLWCMMSMIPVLGYLSSNRASENKITLLGYTDMCMNKLPRSLCCLVGA